MKRYTGENIELRRKQLKITQDELCIKILISKTRYYRCVKSNNFTLNEIDLIAKVLKVPPCNLVYSRLSFESPFN